MSVNLSISNLITKLVLSCRCDAKTKYKRKYNLLHDPVLFTNSISKLLMTPNSGARNLLYFKRLWSKDLFLTWQSY